MKILPEREDAIRVMARFYEEFLKIIGEMPPPSQPVIYIKQINLIHDNDDECTTSFEVKTGNG